MRIEKFFTIKMKNEPIFLEAVKKFQKKLDIKIEDREVNGTLVIYTISILQPFIEKGYTFLGLLNVDEGVPTLISEEGVNLFNTVDMDIKFECDVCKKKITNRQKKYFFKNPAGEIVNVGKNCADKEFGIAVVKELMQFTVMVHELELIGGGEEGFGGRGGRGYTWFDVVEWAIRWFVIGRRYVKEQTINDLMYYLMTPTGGKARPWDEDPKVVWKNAWKTLVEKSKLNDEEVAEEVEKIRNFYVNLNVKTDFDFNLKNAYENHSQKDGLVLYGVFHYYKTIQKTEENKKLNNNFEHYTEENVTDETVEFVSQSVFEGAFGETFILTFTNDKYCFKWFTTSTKLDFLEKGNKYVITKGTVRKRDEFNGMKQNVIKTRFNWIKEVK